MEAFDVFILAAGKGERLRPLTLTTPKPLLKVKDKPLLEYVMEPLKSLPIRRCVINAWYLKEQIHDYVRSLQGAFPFSVEVSLEDDLLGTGGGLKKALTYFQSSSASTQPLTRILMLNGDCLWNGDLQGFITYSENLKQTLGTWWLVDPQPNQTDIRVRANHIVQIGRFWKRSLDQQPDDFMGCFSGIQWLNRISSADLPDKGCIVRDYWVPRLEQGAHLGAATTGLSSWTDIGTPERYRSVL